MKTIEGTAVMKYRYRRIIHEVRWLLSLPFMIPGVLIVLLAALIAGCATHYIPVEHDVYKYQPIPAALLQDCPGTDWTKVVIWRDVATAAVTERAARQKCQDEIDGIRKLTSAPTAGTR